MFDHFPAGKKITQLFIQEKPLQTAADNGARSAMLYISVSSANLSDICKHFELIMGHFD